ncbi:hypothetical protein BC835DRAFT_997045 [Cytidiella melzeri]|nr:hypothetical protein BC835DRAFT_997045 [Cytidiella melzeri]
MPLLSASAPQSFFLFCCLLASLSYFPRTRNFSCKHPAFFLHSFLLCWGTTIFCTAHVVVVYYISCSSPVALNSPVRSRFVWLCWTEAAVVKSRCHDNKAVVTVKQVFFTVSFSQLAL